MSKLRLIALLLPVAIGITAVAVFGFNAAEFVDGYQSPYSVTFDFPVDELRAADQTHPRNDPQLESSTPFDKWYSQRVLKTFGAWGPAPRHYPALPGEHSTEWKRQRVLATACSLIGLPYQHHHIPDWDPPASWPWKTVAYGKNSKGMDCSDFTSWAYNYGLGIYMSSGIRQQAHTTAASTADGDSLTMRKIFDRGGYDELVGKLRTGDLLYIRKKGQQEIAHVIMWVGKNGHSPDGTPLVIDCTGPEHTDSNGSRIPIGVHLRPFTKSSWYYKSFAHANRILTVEER